MAAQLPQDDFDTILPKLKDPQLGGLIFGSPSYFRLPEFPVQGVHRTLMPLREGGMVLADKPVGALAVGGNRNGGQEAGRPANSHGDVELRHVPVGGNSPACSAAPSGTPRTTSSQDETG